MSRNFPFFTLRCLAEISPLNPNLVFCDWKRTRYAQIENFMVFDNFCQASNTSSMSFGNLGWIAERTFL